MNPQLFTLIDPDGSSKKYYRLEQLPGFEVLAQWGRIGGPHQAPKRERFDDQAAAEKAIGKRIRKLERDGYEKSQVTEIDQLESGPLEQMLKETGESTMRDSTQINHDEAEQTINFRAQGLVIIDKKQGRVTVSSNRNVHTVELDGAGSFDLIEDSAHGESVLQMDLGGLLFKFELMGDSGTKLLQALQQRADRPG
jgi:predicted DNA-binding WGR domain protein